MKIATERWINIEGDVVGKFPNTRVGLYIDYCTTLMDEHGYIPQNWEYGFSGSIRHLDGDATEERKFISYADFDYKTYRKRRKDYDNNNHQRARAASRRADLD